MNINNNFCHFKLFVEQIFFFIVHFHLFHLLVVMVNRDKCNKEFTSTTNHLLLEYFAIHDLGNQYLI